jgi:hypothetical protein
MRASVRFLFARALVPLHLLVLVHRAHAAVDGGAGRFSDPPSPILLLGDGAVDVGALTRCRLEAHAAVFDSESLADLERDRPGANDAPPDMCTRPQLACRVASAASRCRLHRGGARSRGACDAARDCERCVLDELARGRAHQHQHRRPHDHHPEHPAETHPPPLRRHPAVVLERDALALRESSRDDDDDDDDDVDESRVDRAMEWSVYQQELAAVDAECRHVEARWRAETTARTLARVAAAAEAAEREATASRAASSRWAKTVAAAVDAAAAAATALTERLASLERSAEDVSARVVRAAEDAKRHEEEEAKRHEATTVRAAETSAAVTSLAEDATRALAAARELAAIGDAARERLATVADGVARIIGERTTVRILCMRIVACVALTTATRRAARGFVERRIAAKTTAWRESTDERLEALAHSLEALRAELVAAALFEPRRGLSSNPRRRRRETSAAARAAATAATRAERTATRARGR